MVTVHLTGNITADGELKVELPEGLPAGEVRVTIEVASEADNSAEERPLTEEEIRELTRIEPKTGEEIVAAGHTGGWEHYGITDSAAWVEELRHKRRKQHGW
jgi:hypothetical protein